ncbi:MAG: hypothetical protein IIC67_08385 [Thaumarchaeota archaeon]|nr:hypothetical protein [Nitrososphaerota archaeon]
MQKKKNLLIISTGKRERSSGEIHEKNGKNAISDEEKIKKLHDIKKIAKEIKILPEKILELLKKININRTRFVHDAETRILDTTFNHDEIIDKLIDVSQELKEKQVYPIQIQVRKEITNEFGVRFLEAIDYDGNNWTIITDEIFLNTNRNYLMFSNTKDTAINPFIVSKFW